MLEFVRVNVGSAGSDIVDKLTDCWLFNNGELNSDFDLDKLDSSLRVFELIVIEGVEKSGC